MAVSGVTMSSGSFKICRKFRIELIARGTEFSGFSSDSSESRRDKNFSVDSVLEIMFTCLLDITLIGQHSPGLTQYNIRKCSIEMVLVNNKRNKWWAVLSTEIFSIRQQQPLGDRLTLAKQKIP